MKNMNDSNSEIPSDIEEEANSAVLGLIPEKSKNRYDLVYKKFEDWCKQKKVKTINEKVLLVYFDGMKTLKSSTVWSTYSMLKTELQVKRNINIKDYATLIALLKKRLAGYHPKKSKILTKENIEKFFKDANDNEFLFAKVAAIIGIAGACRKAELTQLRVQDVVNEGSFLKVTISQSKTHVVREFVVTRGDIAKVNLTDIIRKYINLRPQITKHDRFFVNYRSGKCGTEPVGINTFGKLPQKIAEYLQLPHSTEYTGHCFRRSSASLLANSGADFLKIKQHGGWRSSSVAGGYVESSLENKKKIAHDILGVKPKINITTIGAQDNMNNISVSRDISGTLGLGSVLNLNNCSCPNLVVNVYNSKLENQ